VSAEWKIHTEDRRGVGRYDAWQGGRCTGLVKELFCSLRLVRTTRPKPDISRWRCLTPDGTESVSITGLCESVIVQSKPASQVKPSITHSRRHPETVRSLGVTQRLRLCARPFLWEWSSFLTSCDRGHVGRVGTFLQTLAAIPRRSHRLTLTTESLCGERKRLVSPRKRPRTSPTLRLDPGYVASSPSPRHMISRLSSRLPHCASRDALACPSVLRRPIVVMVPHRSSPKLICCMRRRIRMGGWHNPLLPELIVQFRVTIGVQL